VAAVETADRLGEPDGAAVHGPVLADRLEQLVGLVANAGDRGLRTRAQILDQIVEVGFEIGVRRLLCGCLQRAGVVIAGV
jgi:hypothetical protein